MNLTRRTFGLAAMLAPSALLAQPSTSVSEYIASRGAEAVFAELRQLARNHAGWLLILRRAGVPSCLLSACNDLGLRTTGQVAAFAERCALSYAEVDALYPAVELDATNLVPWKSILDAASAQFVLSKANDAGFGASDAFTSSHMNGNYFRLPYSKIVEAAQKFPKRDAEFWKQDLCEAKVWSIKAWFADQGYGNAAVGLAGLFLYRWGQFVKGHAVACAVDDSNRIWLIDGAVYPATHCKFAGNDYATSSKLAAFNF